MLRSYIVHQEQHGYAFWAVVKKESSSLIGDAGFELQSNGDVDFGYTLGRPWWGRGYATEAARLCLAAVRSIVKTERVVAMVDPSNPGSSRVLEKLGFSRVGSKVAYGREHDEYRLVQ